LQIALRIDPVQLRRLCRTPNYAEWPGGKPLQVQGCKASSGPFPDGIRHSIAAYSASRNASRLSPGR